MAPRGPYPPVVGEDAAQRGCPERFSTPGLLGKQTLLAVTGTKNEQFSLSRRRRRLADANIATQPDAFRCSAWPSLQQAGLTANVIVVDTTPTRPITCNRT